MHSPWQGACSCHTRLRSLPLYLALGLGLLVAVEAVAQPEPAPGELLCLRGGAARHADRSLRFGARSAIALKDRVVGSSGLTIDVKKPLGLCLPTRSADASPALELYNARIARTRPAQARPAIANQRVTNRFGTDELDVQSLDAVLVPSSALLDPPPAPSSVPSALDAFACYEVERSSGRASAAAPAPLTLESAIGTWQFDVRAPTRLCFPADLDGSDADAPSHPNALACYRAKLTRTKPPQGKPFPRSAAVLNRFGSEQLKLTASLDFCVPSDASAVGATPTPGRTASGPTPTPTFTPPPDFTLRIDPASASVDIGTSAHLKATAVFTNGDTEDFTERVLWSSSSEAIEAPNVAGDRGRVDAVDAGSATISVVDAATGVNSASTGDDAILTVNWTLERLELQPPIITRGEGESFRLRAVGHFAGGYARSIAKRVVYASSDPSVGKPTNDVVPSEHARVLALAPGTAILSATDPLSNVSSTASGDDVALTVAPPLERCAITRIEPVPLATNHEYQLTARGFYPGGFERNLTQQVVWSSDAPAVLEAPNTEGDRSRVKALFPGEAHVSASDSVTGKVCENAVTFQVGEALGLGLYTTADPLSAAPRRVGDTWHLRVTQSLSAPAYYKYVTEKVLFSSSDPTVVSAPNTQGDHGRVDAVGSGTAFVKATDPVDGQTTYEIPLRSLAGLSRVEVLHRQADGGPLLLLKGYVFKIETRGHYADGPGPLWDKDVVYASDNPAVVEIVPSGFPYDQGSMRGIDYGFATISVVDTQTGLSSDAFGTSLRVAVPGPLQRIELVPAQTTRRVSGSQAFAAIGHYEGGVTDLITQNLTYSSSDPVIAVATNTSGNRSLIEAVAPGSAVIDATDPSTGISTADSGDGATLTIVGPLVNLRVLPTDETRSVGRSFSFTAIGTDADGREINVTQTVTWSSSDPSVAVATNPDGNKSRVDAVAEGTTTISAYDPQDDISSSASGDDATLVVSGILESITLGAEKTALTVGEPIQLTATGHLVGGGEINLTQQLEYGSSAPAIAKAENPPGDRSRVLALAPGTAIISAFDPGTGIATTPAGNLTLTITAP